MDMIISDLPVEVLLAATASDDDVGVFLRAHHLVEQAAERAAQALYEKYDAFGHDTLSKHLNALVARGADGPVFRAARIVAKHRRDFAHTRVFLVTDQHVASVRQELKKENVESWGLPVAAGVAAWADLRPAHRYLLLCLSVAATVEQLGAKYREALNGSEAIQVSTRGGAGPQQDPKIT